MRITNLKIGVRLGLGFAILVTLLVVTGFLGGNRLLMLNGEMSTVVNETYPKTVYANDIIVQENLIIRATRNLLLMTDPEQLKVQNAIFAPAFQTVAANMDKLDKGIKSAHGRELFKEIQRSRAAYVAARREQSEGIEQINQAITQMEQTTQQNAALGSKPPLLRSRCRNRQVG